MSMEIPDFLYRPQSNGRFKHSSKIKWTKIKSTPCPEGWLKTTIHFADEVKSIPSGVRTVFYKEGRKWVFIKEALTASHTASRKSKVSKQTFEQLKKYMRSETV